MPTPILERLRRAAGRTKQLRFAEYQRIVLYDEEHGYFARSAHRAGRDGDFLTAPETAPLFAECLGRALADDADHLAASEFHILEAGAGRGTLARDIWNALRFHPVGRNLHLHLLEVSPSARAEQSRTLADVPTDRWTSYAREEDLPRDPWKSGALVANELFDNLPVRRVMQTTSLQEIMVRVSGQRIREELVPAPLDLAAYLEAQGVRLSVGQSAEVCEEAPRLLSGLLSHFRRGSVLLVDYGDEALRLYDPERFPHGTMAAHKGHQSHTDFYSQPGEADLTSHVNFTPLLETLEAAGHRRLFFGTQMMFLIEQGLPEILQRRLESTRDEFERLRLTTWAKQLYHPEAMGEAFRVLHTRSP